MCFPLVHANGFAFKLSVYKVIFMMAKMTYLNILLFHGEFCETPVRIKMNSYLNKYNSLAGNNKRMETGRSIVINPFFLYLALGGCAQIF